MVGIAPELSDPGVRRRQPDAAAIMPALVAGIHVFLAEVQRARRAGTSPAMTPEE